MEESMESKSYKKKKGRKQKAKDENINWERYIAVFSIGLIILGYFNIQTYYSKFGIDISPYLDASEILFSFSSMFIGLIALATLIMFLSTIFWEVFDYIKGKGKAEDPKHQTWKYTLKVFLIYHLPLYVGAVLYVNYVIPGKNTLPDLTEWMFISISTLMFLTFCWFLISSFDYLMEPLPFLINLFRWSFVVAFLFGLLALRNDIRYEQIARGNPKYDVHIEFTTDSTFQTSDCILYIGATRNYYFFHNIENSLNTVIPCNTVKHIEIKEVRNSL